jgi:hypothetical protein
VTDPWGDTRVTPGAGNNPWADGGPGESDSRRAPRRHWQPNTARVVITKCGHIELEWEILAVLGTKFVPHVYCETCEQWVTYKRATAQEIIATRIANNTEPLF